MDQLTFFGEGFVSTIDQVPNLVAVSGEKKTVVYWKSHFAIVAYKNDDAVSKRMAAVFLIQSKVGNYEEVAILMGWSVSTIHNFTRSYRANGPIGLIKQKTGPQHTKVTPEILQFIHNAKKISYNKMVRLIKETYGVSLSPDMVSYVKRGKAYKEQMNLFSDDYFLESMLTGEMIPKTKEPLKESNALMTETPGPLTEDDQRPLPGGLEHESLMETLPIVPTSLPINLIHEEKTEVESNYAGGFLLLPFLQKIDPAGLFRQAQEENSEHVNSSEPHAYGMKNWMMTLIFLLWFQFSSIEQFKFVQPREFGVLLGSRNRTPSVKTLRRYFKECVDERVTENWMLQLVRRYVQLDVIELGTLYFDGHKIPYYGHVDLPKGYTSSRRFPMKVLEQVFANDQKGRPVFLRVHDTSLSFRDTVLEMIKDALQLWNENGKRSPLVVAFDRELYDTKFFSVLDELGVLYITWRKWDTPVVLADLTDLVYHQFPDTEGIQEGPTVQYHYWCRNITVQGYDVEAISFLATEKLKKDQDRNPSTLVTNSWRFTKEDYPDFNPLSTGEIIDTLCHRWRQENYFRYAKHEQRLDYIPSYETAEREVPLTKANPLRKALKKEIKKIQNEVDKLNQKIAQRLTARKKKDKPLEEILQQKSIQILMTKKEERTAKSTELTNKLSAITERIAVQEDREPSLELTLNSKQFLDVLRIVLYNAEQMLKDVFSRCYNDPRDLHALLRAISDQGGTVEEQKDVVIVRLKALHIPAYRKATEKLCIEMNAMETKIEKTGKRLFFSVK
ncbi:putative transposase [Paenisporosarcina sp. TG20]|uniref:putative transposase n=1 Tax=Paenisporosarcina sp. TG20 TaxID=1211706 RepID=UPI000303073A|nr:hypothetical protein [Paenisporosarcina sp. TG20]